jgi:hypothetical protein
MFCHNPYAAASTFVKDEVGMGVPHNSGLSDSGCESRSTTPASEQVTQEEEGMGRRNTSKYFDVLSPMIAFHQYRSARVVMGRADAEHMGLVRLFVGQVPYHLEPGHVAWMLEMLSGRRVPLVEKIVRWTQSRKPCGCFHVYCAQEDVDALLQVDQTVLCEAEVLWHARDAAERRQLESYCKYLRESNARQTLPLQLMTVQFARQRAPAPIGGALL